MVMVYPKWLRFLVWIVTMLIKVNGNLVPIIFLEDAVAKGAVCLDGSPPAYHYEKGFGAGINNWLIHMEDFMGIVDLLYSTSTRTRRVDSINFFGNRNPIGNLKDVLSGHWDCAHLGGAWCSNAITCFARTKDRLGSSKLMTTNYTFSGILSGKAKYNPEFYNWHRIKVRYCDGSSYTGDVEAVDPEKKVFYRGARVWKAIMDDLLAKGMSNAQNAILGGCSAGGLGAILQCDNFRALLPYEAKVKCLSDAGFFINIKDITGRSRIQEFFAEVVKTHESAKNLPSSCTSKFSPELCFFPEYAARDIQTPLFLLNAAYDSWQVKNSLAPGVADRHGTWKKCKTAITNCSDTQIQTMQGLREELLGALSTLGNSSSRGMFINSCYSHCQSGAQETWLRNDSPLLHNTTISKAVGNWYYERNLVQKIDCPYPCDKTCHNRVFEY